MKIIKVKYKSDGTVHCWYFCPGCKQIHAFNPMQHTYNNDATVPTISPSLLHDNPQHYYTCHSFIKAGVIQFLGDCWHELKNQTVQLPEMPQTEIDKLDPDFVTIIP